MAILREEYYIEYDDSKNEWELKTKPEGGENPPFFH